jgi:hypothetical protein
MNRSAVNETDRVQAIYDRMADGYDDRHLGTPAMQGPSQLGVF